jgi:hypothetical protein
MADIDYFLQPNEEQHSAKSTPIGYVGGIVLPVLAIVAVIVVGWNGKQLKLMWALTALAVIALLVGPFVWLLAAIQRGWNRMGDQRAAHRYFPLLQEQVARFGQFVGGTSDTLHYICDSTLCGGDGARQARLAMPDISAWSGRWSIFYRRIVRQKPSAEGLEFAVAEFNDLVGTYIGLCANAVFDRLAQDILTAMTPRAKIDLGSFQQRFHAFQSQSEQLLSQICFSRPRFSRLSYSFAKVKPLA